MAVGAPLPMLVCQQVSQIMNTAQGIILSLNEADMITSPGFSHPIPLSLCVYAPRVGWSGKGG